ncbi:MAG: DUF2892 domain-containing protein [Pseudomonadota bacterium]
MTTNIGTLDRVLRIGLGILLIALAATGLLGAWAYIGVVPLVTAFVKFCPAYALFGLRTCTEC